MKIIEQARCGTLELQCSIFISTLLHVPECKIHKVYIDMQYMLANMFALRIGMKDYDLDILSHTNKHLTVLCSLWGISELCHPLEAP